MEKKVIVSWGGGKDSALALLEVQKENNYEIIALLTTLSEDYDRISMHGVRRTLLEQQASSLGLPLEKVFLPKDVTNEEYESKMRKVLKSYQNDGVSSVVFGDIFLEDIRRYREDNLSKIGMSGIFPLWKKNTTTLIKDFIDYGFQAIVTCVDSNFLDGGFAGRTLNKNFLSDLPASIDPCGENGEFHSFVYDGPIFLKKILFNRGEIFLRDNRFYFCDLIPM
jgi:uncharacterized protein (TIGR00290 family)